MPNTFGSAIFLNRAACQSSRTAIRWVPLGPQVRAESTNNAPWKPLRQCSAIPCRPAAPLAPGPPRAMAAEHPDGPGTKERIIFYRLVAVGTLIAERPPHKYEL